MKPDQSSRSESYRSLGRAIRRRRRELRLSQAQLAESSGMDRAYLGSIERGERRPSYGRVLDIAYALGLTGAALVTSAEEQMSRVAASSAGGDLQ